MNLLFLISIVIGCFSFFMCAKKTDWVVLFDGTATDAWRGFQRQDFPTDGWRIENGSLKTIIDGDRCDIITREKFKDFELEIEWLLSLRVEYPGFLFPNHANDIFINLYIIQVIK